MGYRVGGPTAFRQRDALAGGQPREVRRRIRSLREMKKGGREPASRNLLQVRCVRHLLAYFAGSGRLTLGSRIALS
jgi:hypothetical protein